MGLGSSPTSPTSNIFLINQNLNTIDCQFASNKELGGRCCWFVVCMHPHLSQAGGDRPHPV